MMRLCDFFGVGEDAAVAENRVSGHGQKNKKGAIFARKTKKILWCYTDFALFLLKPKISRSKKQYVAYNPLPSLGL